MTYPSESGQDTDQPANNVKVRTKELLNTLLGWYHEYGIGNAGRVKVYRSVIPLSVIDSVLRLIHLEMFEHGLSKEEAYAWSREKRWYPWLQEKREILYMIQYLPTDYKVLGLCDVQIVLHFPDVETEAIERPHLDKLPNDARTGLIIGVPLTPNNRENGGLMIWPGENSSADEAHSVDTSPGDVVVMSPDTWHSGGLNRTGQVRIIVYFRYLK